MIVASLRREHTQIVALAIDVFAVEDLKKGAAHFNPKRAAPFSDSAR